MSREYTVAAYAKLIGKSRSTARRRLQALVYDNEASWTVSFDQVQLPRASQGMKQPPPYTVIIYTVF